MKAVEDLKKQMREESDELGLEGEDGVGEDDEAAEEPPETPALPEAEGTGSESEEEQGSPDSEGSGHEPQRAGKEELTSTQPEASLTEDDHRGSTARRRQGKPPRPASPEVPTKSRRKARARDNLSREATPSVTVPANAHVGDTGDDPADEGEPGTTAPTPELSKREKRRAREAAKAARAEAESTAAVKEVSMRSHLRAFANLC